MGKQKTKLTPESFRGRPLQELIDAAADLARQGGAQLQQSAELLRTAVEHPVEPYALGILRQQLWTVEQQLGLHRAYYSQAGQDRFAYERFFSDTASGTFVEIGAYDGVSGSNTCFFEIFLGWPGVLVEPVPRLAQACRQNRSTTVIEAAVSSREGYADFLDVTDGFLQMCGLLEHYAEDMLATVRQNVGHDEQTIRVPVMTLNQILAENDLKHVQFCSIDTEGAEREVLSAIDFDRFRIDVLAVENSGMKAETGVRDLLEAAGYELEAVIGVDEIYRRLR
ncbi:MAG: FkbM family methyltransferase [Pseudomonadota bacterium]